MKAIYVLAVTAVAATSVFLASTDDGRAQIMGDLPTVTLHWAGTALEAYDVTSLKATKGVVQAQVSDRFALEVSALLRDGNGVVFWASEASKLPLIADKDASMKQGSEVSLTGVGQTLAEPRPDPLAEPRPDPIVFEATVSLVLETGSGVRNVLDTIRATTIVSPRDS